MKCVIVDDEPFALALIQSYIEKAPFLELAGAFGNPYKALDLLRQEKADLLFLDINMPGLSGMQLLATLPAPPMVIFTTAYPEFGAESYEYNAIDYLLKPVTYTRFLRAVNKAAAAIQPKTTTIRVPEEVLIKSGQQFHKIKTAQILYVEAAGNYMCFYTTDKKILSLMNMQELLALLPGEDFIRVHKSYVISLRHITLYEKNMIHINSIAIPVGMTYRPHFMERLRQV